MPNRRKRTWFAALSDEEIKDKVEKFKSFDKWIERNRNVSDESLREQINI